MGNRQQDTELEDIGGEPLDGSGFENEEPVAKDEIVFTISSDHRKGEGW